MAPSEHVTRVTSRLDGVVALDLEVLDADDVLPGLRRLRLGGDLAGFAPWPGQDLMVSVPPGADAPRWRRYTVRHLDEHDGAVELWVTTATDGPGAAWALGASPGDRVEAVGPRGKIALHADVRTHVFVVDESGLAAAAVMAEAIEPPARVLHVALLVPDPQWAADDTVSPRPRRGVSSLTHVVDVTDLDGATSVVTTAVRPYEPERCAAYVFGELALTRRFSDTLVELGVPAERVASKPYWRDGRANESNGEPDRAEG